MATQDDVRVQCAATHAMLENLFLPSGKTLKQFAFPSIKVLAVLVLGAASVAGVSAAATGMTSHLETPKERAVMRMLRRRTTPAIAQKMESGSVATVSGSVIREEIRKQHGKGFLGLNAKRGVGNLLHAAAQDRSSYKTGMYLSAGSAGRDDFRVKTEDAIRDSGGDAMVIEVKGGDIYFQSTSPMAQKFGTIRPLYDLPAIVSEAHAKNLYVIARFVAVKDDPLASADPATQIRNPVTGVSVGDVWVDPGAPDTIQYNKEIIDDVLKSGIDELNLDYIRYPTEYAQSQIGLTTQQKEEHLEAFLKMARGEIDALSPSTKLGISTYAILGWDFDINNAALGQNFIRFAPLLDVISPMAYPDSFTSPEYYVPERNPGSRAYSLVYRTLAGYNKLLGPDESKKVRPWLQAYYFTPDQIHDEIKAVYDAGHCGFTFWNANNNYGPAYQGFSDAAGDRPASCTQ